MKVKVLLDNKTYIDQYYFAEPAVSYLVEIEGAKILFDTGYSGIFLENVKLMNLTLEDITHLVISHGHNDHTWGLAPLLQSYDMAEVKLVAHPDCFNKKSFQNELIGSEFSLEELKERMPFVSAKEPYWLTEDCVFLGEIPELLAFDKRHPIGETMIGGKWEPDMVLDDSALVCKTEKGLFIITGCSHSGICNIIEYAKQVCNEQKIYGVLGGFHLFKTDERLEKTIDYLVEQNIEKLCPAHCVSLKAKIQMAQRLKIKDIGVNFEITV